jgi:hypothetical protein
MHILWRVWFRQNQNRSDMRTFVTGLALALAGSLALGPAWSLAQDAPAPRSLSVTIRNLPAGAKLIVALNSGKTPDQTVPAVASDAGDAALALDLGNLGKNDETQVDVYVSVKCPDGSVKIVIVAHGEKPPTDCDYDLAGIFWLNRANGLTINYPGSITPDYGLFSTRNLVIGGAAAGALLTTLVIVSGDDGSNTTNPGTGGSAGSGSGPTAFSGTYTGTATATTNTCGFSPTAAIRGVLTVNGQAVGTWSKTHTSAGVTFNFNVTLTVNGSQATFQATTVQNVGSSSYTITDTAAQITGNSMTLTQRFERNGTPACTVIYLMTLTKS